MELWWSQRTRRFSDETHQEVGCLGQEEGKHSAFSPAMETAVWILIQMEAGSFQDKLSCGTETVDKQMDGEPDDPEPAGENTATVFMFI